MCTIVRAVAVKIGPMTSDKGREHLECTAAMDLLEDSAVCVSVEGRRSSKRCLSIETIASSVSNLPEQKFQCINAFTYEQTNFAQLYNLNLCNSNASINTIDSLSSEQRLLIDSDKGTAFSSNDTKKKSERDTLRELATEQLQKSHYELSMLLNATQMVSSKDISVKTLHRENMQSRGITIPLHQVIEHRSSDYRAVRKVVDESRSLVTSEVLWNRKRFMSDVVLLHKHVGNIIVLNSKLATKLIPFVASDNYKLKKNMLKGGVIATDISLFSANKFSEENYVSPDNYILLLENENNGSVELLESERQRTIKTLLFTLQFKFGDGNRRDNDISLTLDDVESESKRSPDINSNLNPIFQHINNRKQENLAVEMFSIFKNGFLHKKNRWNISKSNDKLVSHDESVEDYILNIENNFFIEDNNTIHSFERNLVKISLSHSIDLSISIVPLQSVSSSASSKKSKVVQSLVFLVSHLKESIIRKMLALHDEKMRGNKNPSTSKNGVEFKRGEIETEIENDLAIINSAKYIMRSRLNHYKMNLFIPIFISDFKKLNIGEIEISSCGDVVDAVTVLSKSQSSFRVTHKNFSQLVIKFNESNIQLCNINQHNKSIVPSAPVSVSNMPELKSVLTNIIVHNYIHMKLIDNLNKKKLLIQKNTDNSFHIVNYEGGSLCCLCCFSHNNVVYADIVFADGSRGEIYKVVKAFSETEEDLNGVLISVSEDSLKALMTVVDALNK